MRGSSLHPFSHHFEAEPVCPQDVVNYFLHNYSLSYQKSRIHVPEPPAIPEVVEEFHQPELHQHVRDLVTAQSMGLAYVGAEVPCHYGILVPEACQGLLQFWQVLQWGGRDVCANDRGPFYVGDDLAAHQARPVEARQL